MQRLKPVNECYYFGLSREDASKRAVEVCLVAAESGQTVLAKQHLDVLVDIIKLHDACCGASY